MDQHSLDYLNLEDESRDYRGAEMHSPAGEPPGLAGYSVCRRLGRGGSADVWLVSQDSTGVKLALKCFGMADGDGSRSLEPGRLTAREEDIRRELLVMSVLDHEHLVKAYGVIRTGEPEEGSFGLLMDYAAGGSLQQLVTARGKLSVGETVTVLTPIAQVLGYLHGKGFTHSDVAPGNVLFTAHGKPLLADLGVARMVGDASGVPDQRTDGFADPAPVDAVRAGLQPERDVYGAAALGWYCLTGQSPPPSAARPPLTLLVPDVPAELAAALEAGLSDDRRQRPAAAELATAVYRSAAALPLDLSRSVHDTVLPELLTRRPLAQPGGRLRNRLRAWGRRLKSRGWVGSAVRRGRRLPPVGGTAAPVPSLPHARARRSEVSQGARHSSGRHRSAPDGRTCGSTAAGALPSRIRTAEAAGARRSRSLAAAASVLVAAALAGAVFLGLPGAAHESEAQEAGLQESGPQESGPAAQASGPAARQPSAAAQPASLLPADVRRRLAAKDPVEAVRGLAELRSLALREGRLDLLDDVNAPNTPAHAADRVIRERLEGSGTVLAGFNTSLSGIRRLPESTPARAVVAATSSATGYEERRADTGVVATGAPQEAVRLRLVLVLVDGRWRIADILPAA